MNKLRSRYLWGSSWLCPKPFLFLVLLFSHTTLASTPAFKNQIIQTKLSSGDDRGELVLVQNDGKIIVAAIMNRGNNSDIAVLRYLKNGDLDSSFGKKGQSIIKRRGREEVYGLAIQSDGKIILGGHQEKNGKKDLLLARFLSNGRLDESFGSNGLVQSHFGGEEEIHYLLLDDYERILIAGFIETGQTSDFLLARYDSEGDLDPSFGHGGWALYDQSEVDRFYGIAFQLDGKILATGSTYSEYSDDDCVLSRFEENGDLDTSFAYEGFLHLSNSDQQDMCSTVITDKRGRIYLTGFATRSKNNTDFVLNRIFQEGHLDFSFGNLGSRFLDFEGGLDSAHALVFDDLGSLYAVGEYEWKKTKRGRRLFHLAMVRFLEDGRLDKSWADQGKVLIQDNSLSPAGANAIASGPQGEIVFTGFLDKKITTVIHQPIPSQVSVKDDESDDQKL